LEGSDCTLFEGDVPMLTEKGLGDVTELIKLVEVPITIRFGVLSTQQRLSMNIVDIMLSVFRRVSKLQPQ
jgi:hypothetical protein